MPAETPTLSELTDAASTSGGEPINRLAEKMKGDMASKLQALLAEVPATNGGAAAPAVNGDSPKPVAQPVPAVAPQAAPEIPASELPPAAASAATKEHWERFRAMNAEKLKSIQAEKEALTKEIETLKKTPPIKGVPVEELEAIKAAKAELESSLERVALEQSPRFKQYYDGGIAKQLKLVKAAAGKFGDEVVKLLQQPSGSERNARLSEIKQELGIEGDVIGQAASAIRQLSLEREEQLSQHRENLAALRNREAAETAEGRQKHEAKRLAQAESIVARAKSLPEFKADPADTNHVNFATGAIEFIRSAASGALSEDDTRLLPVAAMKAQYLESIKIPKLTAELETLRARVAELTSASPRLEGQRLSRDTVLPNSKTALTAETYDPQKAVREIVEKFNQSMGR